MNALKITSCLAPNMDATCLALTHYLGARLPPQLSPEQIIFVNDISWQERYHQLATDQIQVAWICGSYYVRSVDHLTSSIELLAAPIWRGERYQGRPVYFSDVVVHRDTTLHTFADLRGATWVYNEPGSFSGYEAMRYYLARHGENARFFGSVLEAGSHQNSLQMILTRQADVSAIDSTVLEEALRTQPAIAEQIRIITVIGPNPMPPWVVSLSVSAALRNTLRTLLANMHTEDEGRSILAQGSIARFAPVLDPDYNPIRAMRRMAATITPDA